MCRQIRYASFFVLLLLLAGIKPLTGWAASQGTENMSKAQQYVDQSLELAKQGNLSEAQKIYQKFNDTWLEIESTVKSDSGQAYSDIESKMGQVQYAFIKTSNKMLSRHCRDLKVSMKNSLMASIPRVKDLRSKTSRSPISF